jgi:Fe-S oxidoreductase
MMMRSDELARFASATAPISNWILQRGSIRYLMEKLIGVDRQRRLPIFSRNTFNQYWKGHRSDTGPSKHKVAYFVDVYANYNRPEIGIATVALLEKVGVKIVIPDQKTSGMPYFSYGELDKLRSIAKFNVGAMLPLVKDGFEVVATEPTATYCFKGIYPRLLNTDDSRLVATHTHEFLDYLSTEKLMAETLPRIFSAKVGLHISCHQRSMTMARSTINFMTAIGLQVNVIETGTCCGMGGTFGLKTGMLGHELSREVGEPLFELFKNADVDFGLSESSVCTMQLEQGTGLRFEHPVALLHAAVRGDKNYSEAIMNDNSRGRITHISGRKHEPSAKTD